MKKYIIIIWLLLLSADLVAQRVTSYTPSMYRNLEKYWWYRYRLVNDFMKIGTECGESIPMEHWKFNDHDGKDQAYWGDATQHLGNYINALAGEWFILRNAKLSTRRTEEELYYAFNAFDRLDKKAEPSWRDYDHTYPFCGDIKDDKDLNGFFIRDDVPSIHVTPAPNTPAQYTFMEQNSAHFHRSGFYYNTPDVNIERGFGGQADFPGHSAELPGGVTPSQYPYGRGPAEVSQDQMVMLYGGMGMAGFLLGSNVSYNGSNLRETARSQLYRMYEWPAFNGCHTTIQWSICNPITNRCVGDPTKNCNNGGGQIFINSVGAVKGLSHIGLAANTSHPYGQMENTTSNPAWDWAYQLLQNMDAGVHLNGAGSNDLFYTDLYSAFADNWYFGVRLFGGWGPIISFKNTTKKRIAINSTSQDWAWPHLPLMWQIVNGQGAGSTVWFNAEEKEYGHRESYEKLLSDAPFCGCHSYDQGHPLFRNGVTAPDYGQDEDFQGQNARQWSNANRLQDFNKRGDAGQNSDFNNLDYMVVWNLHTIINGSLAVPRMMNPYYNEDYNYDWGPTNVGYGSNTKPLKLNFLEYLSMINKIYANGNLRVRCGKVIDLKPGFQANYGAVFEAKVKDYRCQEEGYVYALVKDVALDHVGLKGTGESKINDEDGYTPLDFPPDGVPFSIPVDSEQFYRNANVDDSITEEQEKAYHDYLAEAIYSSGDSDVINFVSPFLDSKGNKQGANIATNAAESTIYPNPSTGEFTIFISKEGHYDAHIYNTFGVEVMTDRVDGLSRKKLKLPDSLPPGSYTVVLLSEGRDKIVKKLTLIR